jgi:putative methyltransferase (TIGR04325 family)
MLHAIVWLIRYAIRSCKYALRLIGDSHRYLAFRYSHFRGVYETFEQAVAAAPGSKKTGYNHKELAQVYLAELNFDLSSFDHPILSHLGRILGERDVILDFGGNIGTHYLQYRKYMNLEEVQWIVCDVSEIIKVGMEKCRGISNIAFVNDVAAVKTPGVDIFLASGSMQYIASPNLLLPKLIEKDLRPKHILINRVPLYDGQHFVTLQNGGPVCYPQHVFNRERFIRGIAGLGYELIDFWDDNVDSCIIPFHPERSVRVYKGLYFCDISVARR